MQSKDRRRWTVRLVVWCCAAAGPAALPVAVAATAEPIQLLYNERPPFQVTGADGKVGGIVARAALQAFDDAGVAYVVSHAPFNRQRAIVDDNRMPACMMGWRYTAERARIGKFTLPLAEGSLQGAVTRADNQLMKDGRPLSETLGNRALRMLTKDNYSLGDRLDGAIARAAPPVLRTTAESRNMLRMLLLRRADYIFMSEEEFTGVLAEKGSGLEPEQFRYVHFADVKDRVDRRLWCSRSVPDAIIRRLDAAIERRQAPHGGAR